MSVSILDRREAEQAGRIELQQQFIELRAKGWSYRKIAKKLGVSKSALANWGAEFEAEIASLKAMELEVLYERYFLTKEARIKLLGEQIKAIQKELKARDLSEVSTEKLLELLLKLSDQIADEYVDVRPLADAEILSLKPTSLTAGQNGTKLDSQRIVRELERTLLRYWAGLIGLTQARQEVQLVVASLKAYEQSLLVGKLEQAGENHKGRRIEQVTQIVATIPASVLAELDDEP